MLVDDASKIQPLFDARHIHEDGVAAKVRAQVVKQASCLSFGILPAIADENPAHGGAPTKDLAYQTPADQLPQWANVPNCLSNIRDYGWPVLTEHYRFRAASRALLGAPIIPT